MKAVGSDRPLWNRTTSPERRAFPDYPMVKMQQKASSVTGYLSNGWHAFDGSANYYLNASVSGSFSVGEASDTYSGYWSKAIWDGAVTGSGEKYSEPGGDVHPLDGPPGGTADSPTHASLPRPSYFSSGAVDSYLDTHITKSMVVDAIVPHFSDWLDWRDSGYTSGGAQQVADAATVDLSKRKWRIVHGPPALGYLKAWLRVRFVPQGSEWGDDDNTFTELDPYIWAPASLPDSGNAADHPLNYFYGDEHTLDYPSDLENPGTNYVEIYKFSLLSTYTPPDDGSANGYPIPVPHPPSLPPVSGE